MIFDRRIQIWLGVTALAGCATDELPPPTETTTDAVVFESTRRVGDDGRVIAASQRGALDRRVALRTGRPWAFLDEPDVYDNEAWSVGDDAGVTDSGYRVLHVANPTPVVRAFAAGRPTVSAAVEQRAATQDTVSIVLALRNVPAWTIPLRSDFARSAVDLVAAADERAQALHDRREQLRSLAAGTVAQIESAGGRITGRGRYGGWVTAVVPAQALPALAARTDLARIDLDEGRGEPAGIALGTVKGPGYIDADRFIAAGYTGERSNPTRHAYGDITVGVIEVDSLEDEACFLYDGPNCTGGSRLRERFQCDDADSDGNYCEPVANIPDPDDGSVTHGTVVTSIIAADYSQGQGDTQQLGDGAWTAETGHSAAWKQAATGVAPEASVVFFGTHTNAASYGDSFDDAVDRSLDITNSSYVINGNGSSNCSIRAVGPLEMELEDAFDDGILNVVAAGNSNDPADAAATCNLGSPSDVPKALTVNAVDGTQAPCQAAYNDCILDTNYSSTGGMDAEIDNTIYQGVISGVDLVAPTWINNATSGSGSFGSVGGVWNGTSMAAPVVAGAAALVKDWYLANGNTWINNPGILQAVMMSMGDRHAASWKGPVTTQKTSGADRLWGLGKLKLRLLENGQGMGPWGNHIRVTSFTAATPDVAYVPFSTPIPAGAVMVKCVMLQNEDMSGKTDISKIDLVMRLRQPVDGACTAGAGTVTATRTDHSRDLKKMGAIEDSQATIANRCLEVTLENAHVTPSGITTEAVCYYAGVDDDQ